VEEGGGERGGLPSGEGRRVTFDQQQAGMSFFRERSFTTRKKRNEIPQRGEALSLLFSPLKEEGGEKWKSGRGEGGGVHRGELGEDRVPSLSTEEKVIYKQLIRRNRRRLCRRRKKLRGDLQE